jgi:diketogulonate reductase-like aldo/keto reductase
MEELVGLAGGSTVATEQVLYNLIRRGIEYGLLPWCRERDLPVMVYAPIEGGRILANRTLREVAARCEATPAQVAPAWLLQRNSTVAPPKAGTPQHIRENRAAMDLHLSKQDLAALNEAFPPPTVPQPLQMI